ncbi:MAG: peptidase S51 dipeptidase E [Anaerolineales bacterium]|nr:peptidase S51 dipeptidase E [Anaerolineales bacterium]
MIGLTALVGAGEYLPTMDGVDRRLLAETTGRPVRVVCIPAAAGQEGEASVERWMQLGVAHFRRLGAEAASARITDRVSADDPQWAALIGAADLIYFSGGDPLYLYRTLAGTRAWAAVESAWARGAVFAGCSAGAMILGAVVPDVTDEALSLHPAFNKLLNCLILPHFDRLESFRPGATAFIRSRLADGQYALGIDEHTALVGRIGGEWEVMGAGGVSVLTRGEVVVYRAGSRMTLPD